MNLQSRTFVSLLAGALALVSFACGSGSSVTGSTPATGPAPDAPAAVAQPAASGATIAGTVRLSGVGSSAPGGVQALSTTLRVSVVGTSISTTTNGAGQFTLTGVPAGHVQLRFEGSGIDARLDLDGLQNGQTLTISVVCSGNQASMDDGRSGDGGNSEVEFTGTVGSVGSSQLTVAGKTVLVNSSTVIVDSLYGKLSLPDIKTGDTVEVEGRTQSDGSVLASKLKDKSQGSDAKPVDFDGKISSIGSGQLVVAGKTVLVDGSTQILSAKGAALMLTDLKVGDQVDVFGTKQASGSILASKIQRRY